MKCKESKSDSSSMAGKKATLSNIPSSTDRHKDKGSQFKMKSARGKAMSGGKFKG